MGAPLVSTIIAAYNGARYVRESIESALAQTYAPHEVVVYDDGSSDGTPEVLRSFGDRIVFIRADENRGLAVARNRAIERSRGSHVALLDQDDLWRPGKLERQMALFAAHPDLGLVFSRHDTIDPEGRPLPSGLPAPHRGRVFGKLLLESFVGTLTAVYARAALDRVGLCDPSVYYVLDWDLHLRVARSFEIDYVDEVLASHRLHPEQMLHRDPTRSVRAWYETLLRYSDESCLTEEERAGVRRQMAERRFLLGRHALHAGRFAEAIEHLEASLAHEEYYVGQRVNLERARAALGR